ncbi:MAG: hypothetical protein WA890_05980, partial [Micromonospora sp.]
MQEQPPTEPPRREPATSTRRSRSPKPTFTPPTADPDVPASREEPEYRTGQTRPRRAKPAPAVLFQPPDSAEAASRTVEATAASSRPAEGTAPRPRPAPEGAAPAPHSTDATVVGEPLNGRPGPEPVELVAGTGPHRPEPEPTERRPAAGRAGPKAAPKKATPAAKKATPAAKKATPAARKRTAPSRPDLGDVSSDLQHRQPAPRQAGSTGGASRQAGAAEPTAPAVSPVPPDLPPDPVSSAGTTAAGPEPETVGAAVRATGPAKKASAPKKSAPRSTSPKKASPAKKAASPAPPAPESPPPATAVETYATPETREAAVVAAIAVPEPPLAVREPGSGRTAVAEWRAISARVLDHPGFAPELLALAAVAALGPRARDWAEGLRAAYPDADPDGLARLAARRFVRLARAGGAVAAGAG